jgi:hypothetical protein
MTPDQILERKRELFRSLNENVIETNKGELYYFSSNKIINPLIHLTATPNPANFNRVLLASNGKLYQQSYKFNGHHGKKDRITLGNFQTSSDKQHIVQEILLLGTDQQWILEYPKLIGNPYAHQFTNYKDFKAFVGLNHVTYDMLVILFENSGLIPIVKKYDCEQTAYNLINKLHETKQIRLLIDYYQLVVRTDTTFKQIKGINKLKESHDALVDAENRKSYEHISKEKCVRIKEYQPSIINRLKKTTFLDEWRKLGLNVKHIDNLFQMYMQGAKQKHCIGTNYANRSSMEDSSFFTFKYDGNEYDMELDTDGDILQFCGYRNCTPPEKLKELVESVKNREHEIEIINEEAFESLKSSGLTINNDPFGVHGIDARTMVSMNSGTYGLVDQCDIRFNI